MNHRIFSSFPWVLAIALILGCGGEAREETRGESSFSGDSLANGFYPILREGGPNEELVVTVNQRLLTFRPKGEKVPEDLPPRFVVVPVEPGVRLSLASLPKLVRSDRGIDDIHVELIDEEAKRVGPFTEATAGKRVAVVVNGEVVSMPEVAMPFQSSNLLIQCASKEDAQRTLDHLKESR
jgi:preprotein translocase subunit SecD